jgi:hypothetical protein
MFDIPMTGLAVKILTDEQTKNGERLINEEINLCELKVVGIHETATINGKMGVSFIFRDNEGKYYGATTTQSLFEGMCSAFNGAKQRFNK